MISFFLAVCAMVFPSDPTPVPAPVVDTMVIDASTVGLVRADGTVSLVSLADAMAGRDAGATLHITGGGEGGAVNIPGGHSITGDGNDAAGLTAGYRLVYESSVGSITVEQPCRAFNTIDECVAAFRRAVEASQRAFPRV